MFSRFLHLHTAAQREDYSIVLPVTKLNPTSLRRAPHETNLQLGIIHQRLRPETEMQENLLLQLLADTGNHQPLVITTCLALDAPGQGGLVPLLICTLDISQSGTIPMIMDHSGNQ